MRPVCTYAYVLMDIPVCLICDHYVTMPMYLCIYLCTSLCVYAYVLMYIPSLLPSVGSAWLPAQTFLLGGHIGFGGESDARIGETFGREGQV